MPRFFGTVFYRVRDAGWSEVYPINAADYPSAATSLDQLNTARLGMATSDMRTLAGRVSDTDIRGDSFIPSFSNATGTFSTTDTSGDPDDTTRVIFVAGALHRGMRHIHALPGLLFVAGVFQPSAAFVTARQSWMTQVQNICSIARKNVGAITPPFYTFFPITGGIPRGNSNRRVGRPFGLPRGRRLIA